MSKKIPRAVLLRRKAHAELPLPAMPTLVWRCRPNSGAGAAAAGGDSDILLSRREASAVPDPVVSASAAAVPHPAQVVPSNVASKRCVGGGKKRKRKANRAEKVTAAKKRSKAASRRDLPIGVYKAKVGKFESRIRWGCRVRYIGGTFDTPEQASAAYMSVKTDLFRVKLPLHRAENVASAAFDAAKKKALDVAIIEQDEDGEDKHLASSWMHTMHM